MPRRYKPHLRCGACRMHRSLCICALVPRLQTRTRVVLVLHQAEAAKPTNTGLLAARALLNSAVAYRGRPPAGGIAVTEAASLYAAPEQPLLLFPHPDAAPIDAWRDSPAPLVLIVPDGTWQQAGRTRSRLDRGRTIPCVTLPAARAAGPRMRAAAGDDRLSTLEALALALGALERDGAVVEAALLRLYRVMAERTLWSNGRLETSAVSEGVPPGAQPHDPLGVRPPGWRGRARAASAAGPPPARRSDAADETR